MSEREHYGESQPTPTADLERMAAERLKHLEQTGEHPEAKVAAIEAAREQLRRMEQPTPVAEVAPLAEPTVSRRIVSKAAEYRHTLISLQHRMKPAAKSFSKLIHQPTVDSASEALGKTVLRPSVSLGATTTAVLFVGFLYIYDRHYGYVMRGSEVWIALLLGGLIGIALEGVTRAWRQR